MALSRIAVRASGMQTGGKYRKFGVKLEEFYQETLLRTIGRCVFGVGWGP